MIRDAIFIVVVFLANVIQAITGFAGTLLAMPASIHLIGVADAKAVLNMLPAIGCIMIAVQDFSYIRWKELCKICAFMLAGMLAGAKLFELLPLDMLLTAYGVMIVIIAALRLFGVPFPKPGRVMQYVILLAAGLIHGMFVSGGALLVIYATFAFSDKTEFRATLSAVWVVLNSILCIGHVMSGAFSRHALILLLVCVVPLLLSVRLGTRLHKRINQKTFEKITYVLLLISGISAIV